MVICFTYSSNETDSKTEFYAECLLGSSLGTQNLSEVRRAELDRGITVMLCNQDPT